MVTRATKVTSLLKALAVAGALAAPGASQAAAPTFTQVYKSNFDSVTGAQLAAHWVRTEEDGTPGSLEPVLTPRGTSTTNQALGPYYEGTLALKLDSLPAHKFVQVEFDLYLSLYWDGSESWTDGPDVMYLREATTTTLLMRSTFSGCSSAPQHYPAMWNSTATTGRFEGAFTGADELDSLGGWWEPTTTVPAGCAKNAVYRLSYAIPHTGSSLDLRWYSDEANVLEGGKLERFGIDNVRVTVLDCGKFSSCYVPPDNGKLAVEYLFDGGQQTGELAIFSIMGLDPDMTTTAGQQALINTAQSRALSNTTTGRIIVRDSTEKARVNGPMFTGSGYDTTNYNAGTYLGKRTVTVDRNALYAFMYVPAGIQNISSTSRPLFSFDFNDLVVGTQAGRGATIKDSDYRIFTLEDMYPVASSDNDYEDVTVRANGFAPVNMPEVTTLFGAGKNWLSTTPGIQVLTP